MTDVLTINEKPDRNLNIGSEGASKKISFQLAQDFYNEITGKSERLNEYIETPFILTIDDLEQLHFKISQSTEQYNICSGVESYSVKYMNGQSSIFTSFDRLKLHISDINSPIEEIDVTYKLLIVLPKTDRPQEYIINIELISKVAKVTKMRKEIDDLPFPPHLISFSGERTGKVLIDFIDISVANYIMATVNNWVENLDVVEEKKALKFVAKKSKHLPFILKYFLLAILSYYAYIFSNTVQINNLNNEYQFLMLTFLSGFMLYRMGDYLGVKSRYYLNQIYDMSYINITKADTKLIKRSEKRHINSMVFSFLNLAAALLIGIVSSLIASNISK